MLAKTPVIQCSPCYSAISALSTNPLPDCSNYLPLLSHPLPHSGSILHLSLRARPFTKPLSWRLIFHCCSALLQSLVGNSGETQCLEEAEQQAEASVDAPLQIVNSVSFLSISILSVLTFSILSLLPLHHPFFLR